MPLQMTMENYDADLGELHIGELARMQEEPERWHVTGPSRNQPTPHENDRKMEEFIQESEDE